MKKIILPIVVITTMSLVSCNRQDEFVSTENIMMVDVKKVEAMKDFAKLLGKTLSERQSRHYVEKLIQDRNDNSEAITVNALLGKKISLQESELLDGDYITSRNSINKFRENLMKELITNIEDYPNLKSGIESNQYSITSRNSNDVYEQLSEYFAKQDLDVYFPYSENFSLADETEITVTWDPMTNQETNSGYIAKINSLQNDELEDLEEIDNITDDYAYEKPTLVVRPATWIGKDASYFEPDDGLDFEPDLDLGSDELPDWAFKGWQGLLTFNVDHTEIKDEDVLKVSIPKIRLMRHLATFLTPTTITLVRSSANLVTDSNNYLVYPLSADSKTLLTRFHIKRKDARKHNWVDVNVIWDDDWNMHEAEHNLTWASHHTFSGSLDANGTVKLGWDVKNNKPTVEPKIDINFNVKVGGNCRLRYNDNISRRAVLSQIVGDTGAGTYNEGNVKYSIRTASEMQYYFKPYLTKIIDN